jgi:recombination protein RecT
LRCRSESTLTQLEKYTVTTTALQTVMDDIYGVRDSFVSVLSDRDINFEREAGFAIQAISRNDYTLKIAAAARQSVVDAVTNIAAIGISLNPAKKQAYLVPRDNRICLDISYMGLMDLAMATGSIKWAQAALVHEQDQFVLNGYDKPPSHNFSPFSTNRGPIVGVYVVVKTADGEYLTHTMDVASAHAIRDRSAAWKQSKSGPWKTDEGEMIKKTCVKQAYKYWPKTERLEQAIHYLNTDGGEGLNAGKEAPAQALVPAELMAEAKLAASMGVAPYEAFWANTGKANRKLLAEHHDRMKAEARRVDNPPQDVEPREAQPEGAAA